MLIVSRFDWGSKLQQHTDSFACWGLQPMPEKGFVNLTSFYVVPNGPQRSSVFFNGFFSEEGYKTLPLPGKLVFQLRPKWASHLFVHNVFDGDSKILREAPRASTLAVLSFAA